MTEKEKHIAKKKKEMIKIAKLQAKLIIKAAKIATLPYKRPVTLMRRMCKVLAISMQVRSLDIQKHIIASHPIPKEPGFPKGGSAIVGESGPEQIITPNGTFEIPTNQHPNSHQQPACPIRPVPGIDKEPDAPKL
jgi:hypothetical protein